MPFTRGDHVTVDRRLEQEYEIPDLYAELLATCAGVGVIGHESSVALVNIENYRLRLIRRGSAV